MNKSMGQVARNFSIILFFSVFCFFSCNMDVGLGEEVDIVAPKVSIVSMSSENESTYSFAGGVFCHREVAFTGTASDNKKVTSVHVQIKWADETYFKEFKTASLSGENWSLGFTFEKEGTAFLKFIAEDAQGNQGARSSKTIILFVDEEAPIGNAWYIDRKINGIQYNLHSLEELKSIDLNKSENIDAAQNVAFAISANFNDTMGIDDKNPPKISIYDEDGNQVCEISKTNDSTVYAPVYEITEAILKSGKAGLNTGKHYLQVRYTASDIVTTPAANTISYDETNSDDTWFIWYPEADKPRYELSTEISENAITAYVNDVISITIFDDDELDSASYSFAYKDQDGNSKTSSDIASISSGEREKTLIVKMPSTPQTASLTIKGKGKEGETDGGEAINETITVNVIDESSPMLLITSPKNNSVPAVSMTGSTNAKVTIEGQALDASGCDYLEFVWVPDSIAQTATEKSAIAKDFLSSLNTVEKHNKYRTAGSLKKTEINEVGVLWSVPLTKTGSTAGFITQTFSFEVDLFTDFMSENKQASDKYFVARLTRGANTGVFSEYRLAGDTSNPTITPISPSGDMAIISASEALVLEFKGTKTSGIGMDSSAYEIRRVDSNANDGMFGTYDSSLGYARVTGIYDEATETFKSQAISTDTLQAWKENGVKPKFQFFAKDLFGNEGKDQFTVVISTLPLLKSITSPSSTLSKMGDEILINAVFDNTVTVSDTSSMYVKLSGINNSDTSVVTNKAYYKTGSGSTTLVFVYKVNEGDSSDKLCVVNDSGSPIAGLSSSVATLVNSNGNSTVTAENLLQNKKTIKIDGISPKISSATIETDIDSSEIANYQNNGSTYLKEGRTLSVKITTSEAVQIQGSPAFVFNVGSQSVSLPFVGQSGNTITFSKKITSDTDENPNGPLYYIPNDCITAYNTIVDAAGNKLILNNGTNSKSANIVIDTIKPATPTVNVTDSKGNKVTGGKVANYANFYVSLLDDELKKTEYSTDGGSSWPTDNIISEGAGNTVKLTSSCELTARRTDYAGNISDYSDIISLEINSTFPHYDIECVNPDGNYAAGRKLVFKVTFDEKVSFKEDSISSAYILVSGHSGESYAQGKNSGKAYLSNKNGIKLTEAQEKIDFVYFAYEVQDPDEFTLKVNKGDVFLEGFSDMYGIEQGSKTLDDDYDRTSIKCDGVAPKVVKMAPDGATASANVYSNGRKIVLTFNEDVSRANGNIIIRRIANWAIPPVLTASEFSTITKALTSEQKEILSRQEKGIDMEDSESLYQAKISSANIYYHGTGQFVGPYKKSTQGIDISTGLPDTSTKYVLDFDIGIREKNEVTHHIGKTFRTTGDGSLYTKKSLGNNIVAWTSAGESVEPKIPDDSGNERTGSQIRAALEAAHYHERIVDVTSKYVSISGKTVTIEFPDGLVGDSNLPAGRKWELVIEKGAFMDSTGNYFGAESDGRWDTILADAVQECNGTTCTQYTIGSEFENTYDEYTSSSWGRARGSISDGSSPVVLIKNGSNEYFWSSGVATPVIRVDRYSYGFGVYQVDSNGQKESTYIENDKTKPTAYVRVRIDCESDGAEVTYGSSMVEAGESNATVDYPTAADCTGTTSETANPSITGISTSKSYSEGTFFAGGNGNYQKACKQFFKASASINGATATGYEGVFQTVVQFFAPYGNTGQAGAQAEYRNHFSIRGTTGWAGEPYIAPFPLRDSQVGSPYLKRCYRFDPAEHATKLDTITKTDFKNDTQSWWNSKQFVSASELSSATGIKITITKSTLDSNYGIQTSENNNSVLWVNSGDSLPKSVVLTSEQVSAAKSNGLYFTGNPGTHTITVELYDSLLDNYDYYWCSYEVLVNSSFSGYSIHEGWYYDWCSNWGWMIPGEYSRAVKMRNWG